MKKKATAVETKSRAPVHKLSQGGVRVAIWEQPTSRGLMHTVSVTRNYLDGKEWKQSSSFHKNDLLFLAKALDQAHTWILQHQPATSAA